MLRYCNNCSEQRMQFRAIHAGGTKPCFLQCKWSGLVDGKRYRVRRRGNGNGNGNGKGKRNEYRKYEA